MSTSYSWEGKRQICLQWRRQELKFGGYSPSPPIPSPSSFPFPPRPIPCPLPSFSFRLSPFPFPRPSLPSSIQLHHNLQLLPSFQQYLSYYTKKLNKNAIIKFKEMVISYSKLLIPFSALTLLVGRQEGHPACKKLDVGLLVVTIIQERCTS